MSIDVRVLSRSLVASLLPPVLQQLDLVEETYVAMAAGDVELPPKPGIHPRVDTFIHAMPAYLRHSDVAAMKWVSGYPSNPSRGLPYITGVIVVNDPNTGLPLAIMDAAEITAARTATATGVCIRRFAGPGWSEAAILGCGEQGRYHAIVLGELNPGAVIRAYDIDPDRAAGLPGRVTVEATARDAVRDADIIVTAGPIVEAPSPLITAEWLPARCLLAPIDFDFYFTAEAIEAADVLVVDDVDQFEYYRTQGHFRDWRGADMTVGEALRDTTRYARIACVNLGVGSLDAAFAAAVLRAASDADAGQVVQL
jgi:alanine dehydrogenase